MQKRPGLARRQSIRTWLFSLLLRGGGRGNVIFLGLMATHGGVPLTGGDQLCSTAAQESHITSIRLQAKKQAEVVRSPITAAALGDIVQTIRAHGDACLEFTTSKLHPLILAMPEERHSMLLTSGFTASKSYLGNLMFDRTQSRIRALSTKRSAAPLSEELEAKHRLVPLRLAWLVWHYAIPSALVASRDQSGVPVFPRRGRRCTDRTWH